MAKIWSVIVAAGESQRMGRPKMLLEIDGMPMLEKVIRNVRESETEGVTVVLGAYSNEILSVVDFTGVNTVLNADYRRGMLSSVKHGVRSLPAGCDACLVFQGDQPFIGSGLINSVLNVFSRSTKGIVIPLCNGRKGHPLLFARKYFENVEMLEDAKGLRSLPEVFRHDVLEFETGDRGILKDIDTWNDYQSSINQ